jgi:hypothetical protein
VKALFGASCAPTSVDVVVDSVAGEDPLMGACGFLWQADLTAADADLPARPHIADHHGEARRAGDDARQARA